MGKPYDATVEHLTNATLVAILLAILIPGGAAVVRLAMWILHVGCPR